MVKQIETLNFSLHQVHSKWFHYDTQMPCSLQSPHFKGSTLQSEQDIDMLASIWKLFIISKPTIKTPVNQKVCCSSAETSHHLPYYTKNSNAPSLLNFQTAPVVMTSLFSVQFCHVNEESMMGCCSFNQITFFK